MKPLFRLLFLLILTGLSFLTSSYSERDPIIYKVDLRQSTLKWTGYYLFSFGEHFGSIALSEGAIQIDNQHIISGHFTIDMKSIKDLDMRVDDGAKDLEGHLMSDDFFSVDKFPSARFEITKTEKIKDAEAGTPNFEITGDLTIKGVKNSLTFPALVVFNDNGLDAKARFKFDRTKWNVHYNSGKFFADVGDGAISDAISVEINLVTTN